MKEEPPQTIEMDDIETAPLEVKPEAADLPGSTSQAVIEEVPAQPRRSRRLAKPEAVVQQEEEKKKKNVRAPKSATEKEEKRVLTEEELAQGMLLKPLLIQERVRDDLWKMLVATCLLNVTTGRAARPIFWQILEKWPTPRDLGMANKADLEEMITNLGLGDTRSSRLILFSRQYAESIFNPSESRSESKPEGDPAPVPWSPIIVPAKSPKKNLPTTLEGLSRESIHPFAGVGQYAMDSFAIYSPLLPGGGAPRDESYWLEDGMTADETDPEGGERPRIRKRAERVDVGSRDDSGDAWRKVLPLDKELVRYLVYRWGIEGIVWDPKRGPVIEKEEDAKRLNLPISAKRKGADDESMHVGPVPHKKDIIDLRVKASDLVQDEEEAAINTKAPVEEDDEETAMNAEASAIKEETAVKQEEVEDDWRLRLPAFLRWNLGIAEEPKAQEASTSTLPVDPNAPNPLSKNAQKKAAKLAKFEEGKLARRAEEKEKAKARKHALKAEYEAGNMTPEEAAEYRERQKERSDKLKAKQRGGRAKDKDAWTGGLVIDLAFDELMQPAEIKSMASQLSYCHSSNRLTTKPFLKIVFSGFHGQLKERMDTTLQSHYNVWNRTEWREDDLGGFSRGSDVQEEGVVSNPFPGQTYIYLTADSDNELETLKEDETYIIGGIVDKNRYKNLCRDKADRLGIKTARLPIGTFVAEMPTRKVLTVNQVFDIMVKYNECQDWRVAFETVIPKRKFKAESKAMSNRGHKRAWEERDSSTASPSQGEHKHLRADSEAGDSDELGDAETAMAVMDVDDEEAALNAQ